MIGIPDHQGVANVGGRLGAMRGPAAFREIFQKMKGRHPVEKYINDLGDVKGLSAEVSLNHRRAADLIREGHRGHGFSVVVGGGHDHGFSHLLGIREALPKKGRGFRLGCLNIDAHLDVRKPAPLISSGSPFFLAIESHVLDPERFVEFGIQAHCNSAELWDYVDRKGVEVVPLKTLRQGRAVPVFERKLKQLSARCDAVVVSFDLDAASAAYAPGVSAPQAEGFTASEIIEMMEIAGKNKKTVSLGLFELNPEHDADNRTARLAATAAYHFVESALF
jgi:formimidoylglutamase